RLSGFDRVAEFNEGFGRRRGGAIESADDGRGDDVQFLFRRSGSWSGLGRGGGGGDGIGPPFFARRSGDVRGGSARRRLFAHPLQQTQPEAAAFKLELIESFFRDEFDQFFDLCETRVLAHFVFGAC